LRKIRLSKRKTCRASSAEEEDLRENISIDHWISCFENVETVATNKNQMSKIRPGGSRGFPTPATEVQRPSSFPLFLSAVSCGTAKEFSCTSAAGKSSNLMGRVDKKQLYSLKVLVSCASVFCDAE